MPRISRLAFIILGFRGLAHSLRSRTATIKNEGVVRSCEAPAIMSQVNRPRVMDFKIKLLPFYESLDAGWNILRSLFTFLLVSCLL